MYVHTNTRLGQELEGKDKGALVASRLTKKRKKDWVVVRHDKQVDTGERGAGLEVPEGLAHVLLLHAAAHKHLRST